MEEQELDIVEFTETFTKEWLERKLRDKGMYGGLEAHLIPLKTDGYLLPRQLESAVEGYVVHRYIQETGGVEPVSSQEIVYLPTHNYTDIELLCQAMYVPSNASSVTNVLQDATIV